MAARGGVVAQVERQPGQEVGELAAQQRQVRAVLEALTGIQESLDLLPVVPDLREQVGMRDRQAVHGKPLHVLVELFQRHRIDPGALAAGRHGRVGGIGQQAPAGEGAESPHDRDGLDGGAPVRGCIPLVEEPKCLGRGVVQLADYASERRPRPGLAPLPAAELRPREDQAWLAKPVGDLLGLLRGVLLRPAAPLPLVHESLVGLPAALSWHRAAPLGGCLSCLHCTASSDKRRGPSHPAKR